MCRNDYRTEHRPIQFSSQKRIQGYLISLCVGWEGALWNFHSGCFYWANLHLGRIVFEIDKFNQEENNFVDIFHKKIQVYLISLCVFSSENWQSCEKVPCEIGHWFYLFSFWTISSHTRIENMTWNCYMYATLNVIWCSYVMNTHQACRKVWKSGGGASPFRHACTLFIWLISF